jgi:Amt family ammonium transporter
MKGKLTLSTLRWVRWVVIPALVVVLLVAATPAFAADEDPVANIGRGLNTVWVLVAAFLVFFMQAGFAFVEAGLTRAKNTVNILFKNTIDFVVATLAFWAIGYALMFGTDAGGLIGTSGFVLDPTAAGGQGDVAGLPVMAFWFFQLVFAGTAATIVSGAMAERTRFIAYLGYSFLISAFIYPIAAHWIWGGGWLSTLGTTTTITGGASFRDFAGSTVVHSIGGWIALLGAIALGPRLGRFTKDGKAKAIPGHSIALVVLGVFILWFGWFGFNPGSQLAADGANADVIALVAANTNLAAAAGGLAAMLLAWYFVKKPDLGSTLNGVLAGLVAVTAPCAFISPVSAVIIGAVGGVIVVLGVMLLERVKVDDPVSAVPVHLLNGIWGTLAVGLFATDTGLLTTGQAGQLIAQIIGIVAVGTWCVVMGSVMFFLLKKTVGLRVSREEELAGLDYHEHGSAAYPADVQGELVGTTAHVGAAAGGK